MDSFLDWIVQGNYGESFGKGYGCKLENEMAEICDMRLYQVFAICNGFLMLNLWVLHVSMWSQSFVTWYLCVLGHNTPELFYYHTLSFFQALFHWNAGLIMGNL